MGIQDRDYYRGEPHSASQVGQVGMLSVTTWLIIINVAVFVLDPLLYQQGRGLTYSEEIVLQGRRLILTDMPFRGIGHFSVYLSIAEWQVWRLLTFQFLHAGLTHLLMNMFSLFFFGPMIEDYLGRRRFLAFYLLCGIGGPIAYVVLWMFKYLIASPFTPLVGASAGIFGILMAAARVAPNATVLIYGVLPMQLKTVAWVLLGLAAYTVLQYGSTGQANAGGEAAHLGGAAVGFMLIQYPWLLNWPTLPLGKRRLPF